MPGGPSHAADVPAFGSAGVRKMHLAGRNDDGHLVITWGCGKRNEAALCQLPVGPFEKEGALPVQEGLAALRIAPAGDGAVIIAGLKGLAGKAAFVAKVQIEEPKP
ncbi:MAG: hypothetical protein KA712_00515 [Myxococcales bacterium]|nr:hypothetical protein [Myxococcales bacterium]